MADQGSSGLLSGFLRQRRIAHAKPWLRGDVLDFGCGGGRLAEHCDPDHYLGVDRDPAVVAAAQDRNPRHAFATEVPDGRRFDTVVALAVIEHLPHPQRHVEAWRSLLNPGGRIVLTTPHPSYRKVHDVGASLGIFSKEAADEHETFLDRRRMEPICEEVGLKLEACRRFLAGANQLFVLSR